MAADALTAFDAHDAVPTNEPLNEPVFICAEDETNVGFSVIPLNGVVEANDAVAGTNVIDVAADAVVAYDADVAVNVILVAALALTAFEAHEAVPTNEPLKEPVLICVDEDTNVGFSVSPLNGTAEANDAVVGINVIDVAALEVMA